MFFNELARILYKNFLKIKYNHHICYLRIILHWKSILFLNASFLAALFSYNYQIINFFDKLSIFLIIGN